MATKFGTTGNDSFNLKGAWSGTLDGLAGIDSLSLGSLTRNQFTITETASGSVIVDTVAVASGGSTSHITMNNMEVIKYSNKTAQIDLTTTALPVVDKTSNVIKYLDALHNRIDIINSIKLTDSSPVIKIKAQQFIDDQDVLNKITSKFHLEIDATSNSDINITFSTNVHGAPSATHFDSITHFNAHNTISYSSALSVVGNNGSAVKGLASIDHNSGIAKFDKTDNTLAKQILAVEKAMGSDPDHSAGHVAIWANGSNTEILIRDNHVGTSIGAGDELIQLVGVNPVHVGLSSFDGAIHYV
ncbi:MAG: hypothetical protein NTY69_08215 [Methylococcales bacterium]|nr:hypothetical protein [Methylococcales bacterium]